MFNGCVYSDNVCLDLGEVAMISTTSRGVEVVFKNNSIPSSINMHHTDAEKLQDIFKKFLETKYGVN